MKWIKPHVFSTCSQLPNWIHSIREIGEPQGVVQYEFVSNKEIVKNKLDMQIRFTMDIYHYTSLDPKISHTHYSDFVEKMKNNYIVPVVSFEKILERDVETNMIQFDKTTREFKESLHGECTFLPHPIYSLIEETSDNMNILMFCVWSGLNETHSLLNIKVYRDFWNNNFFIRHAGDSLIQTSLNDWMSYF